jgi:hypothetical protein
VNKKLIISHVLTLLLGLLGGFLGMDLSGLQKPLESAVTPSEKPVPTVTAGEPVIVDGGVDQPVPTP